MPPVGPLTKQPVPFTATDQLEAYIYGAAPDVAPPVEPYATEPPGGNDTYLATAPNGATYSAQGAPAGGTYSLTPQDPSLAPASEPVGYQPTAPQYQPPAQTFDAPAAQPATAPPQAATAPAADPYAQDYQQAQMPASYQAPAPGVNPQAFSPATTFESAPAPATAPTVNTGAGSGLGNIVAPTPQESLAYRDAYQTRRDAGVPEGAPQSPGDLAGRFDDWSQEFFRTPQGQLVAETIQGTAGPGGIMGRVRPGVGGLADDALHMTDWIRARPGDSIHPSARTNLEPDIAPEIPTRPGVMPDQPVVAVPAAEPIGVGRRSAQPTIATTQAPRNVTQITTRPGVLPEPPPPDATVDPLIGLYTRNRPTPTTASGSATGGRRRSLLDFAEPERGGLSPLKTAAAIAGLGAAGAFGLDKGVDWLDAQGDAVTAQEPEAERPWWDLADWSPSRAAQPSTPAPAPEEQDAARTSIAGEAHLVVPDQGADLALIPVSALPVEGYPISDESMRSAQPVLMVGNGEIANAVLTDPIRENAELNGWRLAVLDDADFAALKAAGVVNDNDYPKIVNGMTIMLPPSWAESLGAGTGLTNTSNPVNPGPIVSALNTPVTPVGPAPGTVAPGVSPATDVGAGVAPTGEVVFTDVPGTATTVSGGSGVDDGYNGGSGGGGYSSGGGRSSGGSGYDGGGFDMPSTMPPGFMEDFAFPEALRGMMIRRGRRGKMPRMNRRGRSGARPMMRGRNPAEQRNLDRLAAMRDDD